MKKTNIKLNPSSWIVEQIRNLQPLKQLQVLDFASGEGRHCINLANSNRIMTAVDKDNKKLEQYKNFDNIHTINFDLETDEEWPLKKNYYDVILVVNYLYRPKIKCLTHLLKEGGYLFYETFAIGNEKYGTPKNPNFLLRDRELINIFSEHFTVLSYFNGKVKSEKISIKQRCVLKKMAPKKAPLIKYD